MALRYAVASGNWSNTATWNGGTLPGIGDDVHANGFNVTIDTSVTALSISTVANSPAVAGGTFTFTNGITVTANLINGITNSFLFALNNPNSCTIIGNLVNNPASINVGVCVLVSGSGTVNLVGNISTRQNSSGINITGAATINMIGTINAGTQSGAQGITTNAASAINVTGTVTGGSTNATAAIFSSGSGTITVNGIVNAGGSYYAVQNSGASTTTVNGQVNGSAGFPAIYNNLLSSAVIINGNAVNVGGIMAIYAPKVFIAPGVNSWKFTRTDLTTDRTLYTAETLPGVPTASDVRNGTIYGASSELTGTLIVPDPSNVRKGVATDATTGTAEVTGEDIIEAMQLSVNPLAERLRNVATVQTTGDQIVALTT
jgi:hypothetical protein